MQYLRILTFAITVFRYYSLKINMWQARVRVAYSMTSSAMQSWKLA